MIIIGLSSCENYNKDQKAYSRHYRIKGRVTDSAGEPIRAILVSQVYTKWWLTNDKGEYAFYKYGLEGLNSLIFTDKDEEEMVVSS